MNEPYRLRYANQIVGAFLLVVLLICLALIVLLLRSENYFTNENRYWFDVDQQQLEGLKQGVEVNMLGQRVGEIRSVQYIGNTSKVRVNLAVSAKHAGGIFESSVLIPERKFGLGAPVLSIRRGRSASDKLVPLAPGSAINFAQGDADSVDQVTQEAKSISGSVDQIQEHVGTIQKNLDPTLESVDQAATDFSTSLADQFNPALQRIQTAAESLETTSEVLRPDAARTLQTIRDATTDLQDRVGKLTEEFRQLARQDVPETLDDVRKSTDQVGEAALAVNQTAKDTNREIADALSTIKSAAEEVQVLAEEAREVVKIVRREAEDLPGTTDRVNNTMSDAQDLVEEVRGHWLLRGTGRRGPAVPPISPSGVRAGGIR